MLITNCSYCASLQPDDAVNRGTRANDYTFFIDSASWNSDPDPGEEWDISITGRVETSTTPTDLTITMLCYVGVNGCSETSVAVTHSNDIATSPVTLGGTQMTSETTAFQANSNSGVYSPVTTTNTWMTSETIAYETNSKNGNYSPATTLGSGMEPGTTAFDTSSNGAIYPVTTTDIGTTSGI